MCKGGIVTCRQKFVVSQLKKYVFWTFLFLLVFACVWHRLKLLALKRKLVTKKNICHHEVTSKSFWKTNVKSQQMIPLNTEHKLFFLLGIEQHSPHYSQTILTRRQATTSILFAHKTCERYVFDRRKRFCQVDKFHHVVQFSKFEKSKTLCFFGKF